MKSPKVILLAAASLIVIAAPAAFAETTATAAQASATEGQKLKSIFAADDEAQLKRNPLGALFRGDMRYADRLGDFISDEYFANERKAAEDNLAALGNIDRAKLNPTEQIAYDVFKQNQTDALKGLSKEIMDLTVVRPVNHFFGFHTFYPTLASGQGSAPFKTVADYENNLKRHKDYIVLMDRSIDRFRQGMASGVFETKMTITNVVDQLNTQLAQKTEESPYYGPIQKFPKGFSDADKARLTAEYKQVIEQGLYPVNARLRDFLRDSYLPLAREQVGLSAMKGGEGLYQYMIEQTTTLPLKADDIHKLGLSEVARIKTGMEAIKKEVGFKGTLAEFFEHLRTDPRFKMQSREALTQGYYDIGKKVDAVIGRQFKVIPKAPLEIKPYEEFREKYEAGGSYQNGTPDGKRPGTFYFNAYRLAQPYHTGHDDALFARRRTGASFPDHARAGKRGAACLHAFWRQHCLCRRLGALFGNTRLRHGTFQRPLSALWNPVRRDAARNAFGGRYRFAQ